MAAVCGGKMITVQYLVEVANANIHEYCISTFWMDRGLEQTALSLSVRENPDITRYLLARNSSLVHCPTLLVNIATSHAWDDETADEIITAVLDRGYDVNGKGGEVSCCRSSFYFCSLMVLLVFMRRIKLQR
jgi:hypothetical protein